MMVQTGTKSIPFYLGLVLHYDLLNVTKHSIEQVCVCVLILQLTFKTSRQSDLNVPAQGSLNTSGFPANNCFNHYHQDKLTCDLHAFLLRSFTFKLFLTLRMTESAFQPSLIWPTFLNNIESIQHIIIDRMYCMHTFYTFMLYILH